MGGEYVSGILGHFPSPEECVIADMLEHQASARPDHRFSFLEHALNLAKPRVLIAHAGLIERLHGPKLPTLELVVAIGDVPELAIPWPVIAFSQLIGPTGAPRPVLDTPRQPWDDFALIFTSGTTGPSKAVRLSYASHRLYADCLVWPEISRDGRFLASVPLSHVGGTSLTYAMLQRGGTIVLPGAFDAKRGDGILRAITKRSVEFRPEIVDLTSGDGDAVLSDGA